MKKSHFKTWFLYAVMLALFGIFSYLLLNRGNALETIKPLPVNTVSSTDGFATFLTSLMHGIAEPAAMLLLQIICILVVSRIFGFLFGKIGQPTVIGEILAGIVLGPSLLGYYFPGAFHFLFAPNSLGNLYVLSQIGLILFMFTIGMDLNLGALKEKMGVTYVISHASIVIPYFFGMVLAYFVYTDFAAGRTSFTSFALFVGISMSITAFPVLARIVQEKGLTKTHLGTLAIASAAINDVTAWCVLAIAIAIARTGSLVSSLYTIGISVVYVLGMFLVVKPFMTRIGKIYSNSEVLNKSIVAFLLLILIISSYTTEVIGIHALFGAFLAGVIMPPIPEFRRLIIEKVEDLSVTLLLPLFFVFTGLRTEIGLLNTPYLWTVCIIFIVVAISGKFIGGAFTARILGESWKNSLSIGVLMNTRGLMELIVLNIGYEMGIFPASVFVMLVIMALVTTFMTTPVLSLINRMMPDKDIEKEYIIQQREGIFKALIALGNPEHGKFFLNVAKTVLDGAKNSLEVTALHLTPGTDTNPIYGEQFAAEGFKPINQEAENLSIPIENQYKVTDNIESEIVKTVNQNNFDFLLVGAGVFLSEIPFFNQRSLFSRIKWLNRIVNNLYAQQVYFYPGTLIKDKTRFFIENSNCSVGVFVNRNFRGISTTVVMLDIESDIFLLRYARRLLKNKPDVLITILDLNKLTENNDDIRKATIDLMSQFPNSVKKEKRTKINSAFLPKFSFMLVSYQTWNTLSATENNVLEHIPSTLIINKKVSRFHTGARNRIVYNEPYDPLAEAFK